MQGESHSTRPNQSLQLTAALILGTILCSCTTLRDAPHLSATEALRLANAEVGHDRLDDLVASPASYSKEAHLWTIGYKSRHGRNGFFVQVDDRSRKVQEWAVDNW